MNWKEELRALYRQRYFLGLTITRHPLEVMRPWLKRQGFITARQLRGLEAGSPVKVAGEVVIVHTPPQKNATRVIFTTIEDETGLVDLAVFPRNQKGNTKVILENPLVLVWGSLSRRGKRDALVVVRTARPCPVGLGGRKLAAPRGE